MIPVFRARLTDSLRADLAPAALGLAVALAVCGPWFGGRIFALDWAIGPQPPVLPRSAYGLDGGLTAGLPFGSAVGLLEHLLGAPATWLPYVLVFPVAAVALARLAAYAGASRTGQLLGALLYCVNPWVLDRVAVGHVGLLLGYAVLPAFVLVVLRHQGGAWREAVKAGLVLALLMGLSLHFLWITLPVVAAGWALRGSRLRGALWSGAAYFVAAACSAYLLIGPLAASLPHAQPTGADLQAYRTWGSSAWDAAAHLLALQGFWRPLAQDPANVVPAWPLLCAAVLLLALIGLVSGSRGAGERARVSRVVALAGLAGLVLALGGRGPFGSVYQAMYDGLPAFRVMREPQKWAALLALGYAMGFALGVDALLTGVVRRRGRVGAAVVVGTLVLGFTPSLFWGVGGSMKASAVPASYAQADRAMGDRSDGVLVLPWHLYLAFGFTQGRVVANPAPYVFHRDVVSGDVAELPGVPEEATTARSVQVAALVARGGSVHDAGAQIARFGVRYVALLHGGDWVNYGWLPQQRDLRPVFTSGDVDVWEVPAADTPGGDCRVQHSGAARYRAICTGPELVLPEPFDPGWRVAGASGEPTDAGLVAFRVVPGVVTASYAGAGLARGLLWVSLLAVVSAFACLRFPRGSGRVSLAKIFFPDNPRRDHARSQRG